VQIRLLYLLALVPALTDFAENGALPRSPRQVITEAVLGVSLVVLVYFICKLWDRTLALAERDALTGLYNSRRFHEDLPREIGRARRSGQPLALAWIDLDGFKQVNDRLGHAEGDRVLAEVARRIDGAVRKDVDRCYRVGGDEFAVLLPGVDAAGGSSILERVRGDVGGATLSAGVVALRDGEEPGEFRKRADDLMYAAKSQGRNRTLA
jgi:diguanylate cyclase (GGDEF)-like protein